MTTTGPMTRSAADLPATPKDAAEALALVTFGDDPSAYSLVLAHERLAELAELGYVLDAQPAAKLDVERLAPAYTLAAEQCGDWLDLSDRERCLVIAAEYAEQDAADSESPS